MKKCCGVHGLRIAVGMMVLGLLLAGSANAAKTITVCHSGCDYSSIQKAIKASSNGDTILVKSGTYFENVNITKQLTLRGIGNPVVDAGRKGSAITLSANGITLEGFTATEGGSYPETGIKVTSSKNTMSGNNALNNSYSGIHLYYTSNNILIGNNASNNIYGIYLDNSGNNTLSGNMMTGNKENFNLDGYTGSDFENHIDTGNLVDGRPIYYIIKALDTTYDFSSNAGTLYCISCVNVTIMNLNLNRNSKGIYFWNTSQSRIQNVNTSNNGVGIYLDYSGNNTITGSNVSKNYRGIELSYSGNNTLGGNNASSNNLNGIYLEVSSNNTLSGNNASNNGEGIYLGDSSNNTLSGNNASSNKWNGIFLWHSSNNTLSSNKMAGNKENFNLGGNTDSDFENHIDAGNLVDGRPIYYIIKALDSTYDSSSNAGTLYCIGCVNVTIKNLNFNKNGYGIYFWNTSQSRIQNVNTSNNGVGISLDYSSNNTMTGSNVSNNYIGIELSYSRYNTLRGNYAINNGCGIYLDDSSNNNTMSENYASNNGDGIYLTASSNNKIYNNIFNNTNNFYFSDLNINAWNTTRQSSTNIIGGPYLGGNFWANPNGTGFSQTCKDGNGDGICDQSYILDARNIDYLPLSMNFTKDNIPPKSVRKLKNVSYTSSYINWKWNDPKNSDFDKVQIYINNKYKTSVLKGVQHYKAKNLYANRSYTISIRTVDASGNVNLTWKNNTAWTRPDLVPPINVTNLKNITYAKNYINWTWKDPKDNDFTKVMVFIDNKFKGNVSKGKKYFNATNFKSNTRHIISTLTVDRNGNINITRTNHSAWTAK